MYSSVKQQIPEFIKEFLVYCDCFVDINKKKTCWVLTRNLKFFEFFQKQLVASIDLHTTCLSKLKPDLENYNGPNGKWYGSSDPVQPIAEIAQNKISLGKYVFHALNIYKIYVIIQCWDKCVVLKRLPDFKGFEIKAEYEDLLSYRIVHGTIKYFPVLELKFQSNDILKTDFEDRIDSSGEEDLLNKTIEMRHLLERIRCAKTELQLHKTITAQSFYTKQNNLTWGEPFFRTFKLEEKQILGRCGDIWKRFTAYDDLVIGIPLVNQCVPPNLSIIRNLTPVLQANLSPQTSIQLHYRLFQLKIKFDQLDELETFLESEDEGLRENIWCSNGDLQILPESFVVLLIKLKISQIVTLKQSPLILNYEVIRHLHTTSDAISDTFAIPFQLFLQNLDFDKLLFEERSHYELKFVPHTLHQDFLTIAMTTTETSLKIIFKNCNDVDVFESSIQRSLDFLKPSLITYPDTGNYNSIFYNNKPYSLWFGCLILRMKKITEDTNNQCWTTWKIYCQNFDKSLLLIKTFLNDQLTLKCNVISISNSDEEKTPEYNIIKFENALRQELLQLQEIVNGINNKKCSQAHIQNMEKLCQLQMKSDIIACDVIKN